MSNSVTEPAVRVAARTLDWRLTSGWRFEEGVGSRGDVAWGWVDPDGGVGRILSHDASGSRVEMVLDVLERRHPGMRWFSAD